MAKQTNIHWGSYDFDRTRPLGQRFVVALSNPERNLPRDPLEQLGELPLYLWQNGQRVRREEDEVVRYAGEQFRGDVIIVPPTDRRRNNANFTFYRKPTE